MLKSRVDALEFITVGPLTRGVDARLVAQYLTISGIKDHRLTPQPLTVFCVNGTLRSPRYFYNQIVMTKTNLKIHE